MVGKGEEGGGGGGCREGQVGGVGEAGVGEARVGGAGVRVGRVR